SAAPAGPGATTTTISPRGATDAHRAARSAARPRTTSSWTLVSSRHTATGRSGSTVANDASDAPSRRGDSNATTVSGIAQTRAHPIPIQQHLRAPRVLAGDDVRAAQRLQDPRRDVVEVADRRRADDQAPGRAQAVAARAASRSTARTAAPSIPASSPKRAATI